ncbi:hypothetical protein DJ526_07035 [Sulfolobus sp. A20-N-G8]|nr:hypothetical protein DJ526_07035 [Sulfolobus sp. A20-N-G8]
MHLGGDITVTRQGLLSFNPLWDASQYYFVVRYENEGITFNPLWDASIRNTLLSQNRRILSIPYGVHLGVAELEGFHEEYPFNPLSDASWLL